MNRRSALFAVAFLVALAATSTVFVYVSHVDARAVAGQQPVDVLVATHEVPAGTSASTMRAKGWLRTRSLARTSVPDGALSSLAGLESKVSVSRLFPGDVLSGAKLASKAAPNAGALTIPEGQLAVTVELDDPAGAGAFVTPGAQVAVFDTFNVLGSGVPAGDRLQDNHLYNRATRLLLPRTTVLGVGRDVSAGKTSSAKTEQTPDPKVTVTLAVSQRDAERLIHAAETGSLWFGLLTDTSRTTPSAGVDNHRLFG